MHILPTDDDPDTVSGYGVKCGGRYEHLLRRAHASAVVQFEPGDPEWSVEIHRHRRHPSACRLAVNGSRHGRPSRVVLIGVFSSAGVAWC
ncbi:hypothetical protein [Micromonospora sp. KC721]|uniref:hypothetical protein n=1 Tax=Micromonospora sp. KC721 TaxID=2530380 RepID=UPI001042D4D5|nr:hypothetical protein [Micromonospora sp. KC721]TDB79826.1 hypothetical protein E1182_11365 [Micromonospora sp. KC721]